MLDEINNVNNVFDLDFDNPFTAVDVQKAIYLSGGHLNMKAYESLKN